MSDFYSQNDYRSYLQHHGIKGMHWGEQNGPPYPLSTKVHNMVVRNRARRAEKRREKILHDPKKLVKHAPEFTKEEIDNAVAKLDSIDQARRRIRPTAKEVAAAKKAEAAQRNAADNQLAKKIDKYAPNAAALEKNVEKFNNQELREAIDRVNNRQRVFDTKISEMNRPKRFLDTGLGYMNTGIDIAKKIKEIKSLLTPKYDENGFTEDQRMAYLRVKKAQKDGVEWLAGDQKALNNYISIQKDNRSVAKEADKAKKDKNFEILRNEIAKKDREIEALQESLDIAMRQNVSGANGRRGRRWRQQATAATEACCTSMSQAEQEMENDYTYAFQMSSEHTRDRSFAMSGVDEILSVKFSDISI